MQRRGTRVLRPVRNPDGTERTLPTRENNCHSIDESDESGDYEPTVSSPSLSLGDPIGSGSQSHQLDLDSDLDFLNARQRAMLMRNNHGVQTPPSPTPIFRDMGSYMSEFTAQPTPSSTEITPHGHSGHLLSTFTATAQQMFVPELSPELQTELPEENVDHDIQLEESFETLDDILDRKFGVQKDIFLSVGHSVTSSGHHAILGARLLNQVAQHYGLGTNNLLGWKVKHPQACECYVSVFRAAIL
ncbi:hypothetical protein V565_353630, partial [Rhizoctonia solani 123E]